MSGDVTSGEQPTSRAARRAAEQAEASRRSRTKASKAQLPPVPSIPRAPRRADASGRVPAAGSASSVATTFANAAARAASGAASATKRVSDAGGATRRHARVFATILVVPAIVGTVGLPAYALVPGGAGFATSDKFSLSRSQAQDVEVSGLASAAAVASDQYDVTTKADIDKAAAEAAANERSAWAASIANNPGAYYTPAQQAAGDDYPWWNETPDDYGGGLSPLRYYYRECVDFVAWRMNRDAGVTSAPWRWDWSNLASGSAWAWADEWVSRGRQTSSEPVVGAVAWFPYNHVAYVQSVNGDGTVTIEEYNQQSDHSYHVRTIDAGSALYLYPPT
ncbi:CHAP domain-containing protein [Agromyces protaetiae]|uniref:CHAP domain-containing protein n=1 Tax=Agromyces protaetiae TaxID=2509455 RepID=A0A4P6FCE6_9MICO|nr:CHAP domain-containing protein [Agromyces protaetiae]QAY73326.1 CHAP domain-containing protein [Agromyces protaetiae]